MEIEANYSDILCVNNEHAPEVIMKNPKSYKYIPKLALFLIFALTFTMLYFPGTASSASSGTLALYGTPAASNTIVLNWSGNTGTAEVIVERKMAGGDFAELAAVISLNSWTDNTGLIRGASYTYRIKENISTDTPVYSSEVTVVNIFLNAPSILNAAVSADNNIEVDWTDNTSDESGFEIWRYSNGSSPNQPYARVDANTTHFIDENVIPGVKYYYMIRAFIIPEGFYSSYSVSGTVGVGLLNAPSNLKASIISNTQANLSWSDNSVGESGFIVERKQPGDDNWTTVCWLPVNTTSYSLTGLTPYIKYLYRVKVFSYSDNLSTCSSEIEVSTGLPAAATELRALSVSSTQVRLTWKDNSDNETGYRVERSTAGGRMFPIAEVGANTAAYTDSGLYSDTNYVYRISAVNSMGSNPGSELKVTTLGNVSFADVTSSISWAREAIENLAGRGVIRGKEEKLFKPYDRITRAEFTSIIIRSFELDTLVPTGSMKDVWVGSWYYRNVMIAENLGIVSEDESGRFYPDRYITREEMAVIIARTRAAVEKPLPGYDIAILEDFADRGFISQDALASMASVVGEGIMEGRSARAVAPKDTATRAEAAVILYRALPEK